MDAAAEYDLSNMVDWVARALANLTAVDLANFRDQRLVARVAIEAMRSPTWKMKIAGRDNLCDSLDEDASTNDAEFAYRAMINAALE